MHVVTAPDAAWALGRIGSEAAVRALRARVEVEHDGWVREEIGTALVAHGPGAT